MDQSETLGIAGVPHGLPLVRSSVPRTHSIKRNRKSTLKNTFPWKPPKTPKSSRFGGIVGARSPSKEASGPHTWYPTRILQRNAPKTSHRNFQEKTPKITKKEKREKHKQALRNHAESSIHTMKGSYKVYLPPNHPSLSQDLTMKLSS
jgi:hypothetical protein